MGSERTNVNFHDIVGVEYGVDSEKVVSREVMHTATCSVSCMSRFDCHGNLVVCFC